MFSRRILIALCLVAFMISIPACTETKTVDGANSQMPDKIKAPLKTTMPKTKVE